MSQEKAYQHQRIWNIKRISSAEMISVLVLLAFFSALLIEYWPDLLTMGMHAFNSARSVGAETIESRYFEVSNNSNANQAQVNQVLMDLEMKYEAISQFLMISPEDKISVLIVNGRSPAIIDGDQLVISFENGKMGTELAPLFLVPLIEGLPINMNQSLTPVAGYSLFVLEGAGLGDEMLRQSLNAWVQLIQDQNEYIPLEQVWGIGMPSNESSVELFIVAALESGSFMSWITGQYGNASASSLAAGGEIDEITGKSLAENENLWLQDLSDQKLQPEICSRAIPQESLFRMVCGRLK